MEASLTGVRRRRPPRRLIEAANNIFPAVGLPAWANRLVVVLALLVLPVALVLAWAFDIGPAGVTRTQRHNYVRPSVIANVYVALGERETALDWLERGVRDRDGMLQFLDRWWWWWEPFRGDPRFERVRHQVGLPSLGG